MFYPIVLMFLMTALAVTLTERYRRTRIERARRQARRAVARSRPLLFHN